MISSTHPVDIKKRWSIKSVWLVHHQQAKSSPSPGKRAINFCGTHIQIHAKDVYRRSGLRRHHNIISVFCRLTRGRGRASGRWAAWLSLHLHSRCVSAQLLWLLYVMLCFVRRFVHYWANSGDCASATPARIWKAKLRAPEDICATQHHSLTSN